MASLQYRLHAQVRAPVRTRLHAHLHELTIPKKYAVLKIQPPAPRAPSAKTAAASDSRRIQTRRSGVHGKGVFALQDLAEGETLIEYLGELITWKEALRRHPHDPSDPNHTFYFHIDDGHVIDGKQGGNSSRWFNHSCKPNCEADETEGRIFIKALRNIKAGEELFYDYGLIIDARYTPKLLADYPCWCGNKNCRGTLLAPKARKRADQSGKKNLQKADKKADKKAVKKALTQTAHKLEKLEKLAGKAVKKSSKKA
jgi:uncharacterized protein